MGIVVVLIFYVFSLTIAAAIGSIVFGGVTYSLTKQATANRRRAVLAATAFPFLCVAFAGAWFVLYAVTNSFVFHRDPGLGDGWDTPLPNGYALMMIDTTDQGTVYDPRTQGGSESISSKDDAVFGVRQLEVVGSKIYGARDSGYFGRIGQESSIVDDYFELDTKAKSHREFKSMEELARQAKSEGNMLVLRQFSSVFDDYRWTWFDYVAGSVLLLAPATMFVLLARWIWKVRRNSLVVSVEAG